MSNPNCDRLVAMHRRKRRWARRRRGATLVMICLLFPVVLAVAAFAINIVHMEMTRTELQVATDVATRAAGRTLAVTGSQTQAIAAAERFLSLNPVAKKTLKPSEVDIVFGVSTRVSQASRYSFGPGSKPNAVQVKSNGNMQVPMLFPTMGVPVDFRPIKSAISTQMVLDIALVIDRSGSMAFGASEIAGNYPPAAAPLGWQFGMAVPPQSRWLDAVNAVNGFIDLLTLSGHDERLSLSTYSDNVKVDQGLTTDFASIKSKLNAHSQAFIGGATNIGGGIIAGNSTLSDKLFARPWASRVMIVLTDGIHNTGTDPLYAAQLAANENILIFTVTFSNEADQFRMDQVATLGMALHFHATTGQELIGAFNDIAHSLPTLITY